MELISPQRMHFSGVYMGILQQPGVVDGDEVVVAVVDEEVGLEGGGRKVVNATNWHS